MTYADARHMDMSCLYSFPLLREDPRKLVPDLPVATPAIFGRKHKMHLLRKTDYLLYVVLLLFS